MDPSESDLFRAWRKGEAGAFDQLYARTLPRLASYCRLLARDESPAADLFQETWRRALAQAVDFRQEGPVGGWLVSIARNLWIDQARRRAAERGALSAYAERVLEGEGDDPGPAFDAIVFLDRLDPEEKEAVLLYHVQQLSLREAARVMGLSHVTVRARLAGARRKWNAFPETRPGSSPKA